MATKRNIPAGYQFTGIYKSGYEGNDYCKDRAGEIRKQGFKACVITERPSKYDRNPRTGYSVYAEPAYSAWSSIVNTVKRIESVPSSLKRLEEEFEINKAKLREEEYKLRNYKNELIAEFKDHSTIKKLLISLENTN